ncbi:MAG: GTPase HflX [candidate division WOR-3 bacterium]|nr:GTPase HflX [candidate division WOR-3 bacterium]MCX7947411.1 GTPase HflX [candidate division WOR-3 bacterium]MDW8151191.1 GTPase HflX [candidate division WOR-3 bacterium]
MKAILISTVKSSKERWKGLDRLEELAELAMSSEFEVFEKLLQIKERPDPAYLIGKGKVKEISELCKKYNIDAVIFDSELSPIQKRNLEKAINKKVIDRTELIIEIFRRRARTSEAKIQVEIAYWEYQLTHLVGLGKEISLSRLAGMPGTRGPGEQLLENERRRIKERIRHLNKKLKDIERTKEIQKESRRDFIKISLVGYTNVGKSTLMNLLTHSNVYVDDKLFATLDATTRELKIDGIPYKVVISDTVGFIRDLPPNLIASFKATLSVIEDADLILHVIDISHPNVNEHIRVVEKILLEMGLSERSKIMVFNKIDLILDKNQILRFREKYTDSVFISAKLKIGIEKLIEKIKEVLLRQFVEFEIITENYNLYSKLKKLALIQEEEIENGKIKLKGIIHRRFYSYVDSSNIRY